MVKNPPCSTGGTGLIPGQGTKIPHAAEQLCLCTAVKIPCAMTKMRHSHINTLKSKNYSTYASLENRQILGFEYEAEEGTALPAQVLRHLPIGNLRFWLNGSEGCALRPAMFLQERSQRFREAAVLCSRHGVRDGLSGWGAEEERARAAGGRNCHPQPNL